MVACQFGLNKGNIMKNVIQILGAITFTIGFIALVAWGQTEEMCKTEVNKSKAEIQACNDHFTFSKK